MDADHETDRETDLGTDDVGLAPDDEAEISLLGGDVSDGVVRKGATVRRRPAPGCAAVHAYLDHLGRAGFAYAPRFLGFDCHGREILTYLDGEMGGRPLYP